MYQKTKLITPNPNSDRWSSGSYRKPTAASCWVALPARNDLMHGPLLTPEQDIVMRPGAQDFLLIRSRGDAC